MPEDIQVRALVRGFHRRLIEEGEVFLIEEANLAAWMERVDGKAHRNSSHEVRVAALGQRKANEIKRTAEAKEPKAKGKADADPKGESKD